jgi:uncharacterized protein Yka (UPF0111/DUF47 family)
MKFQLIPKNYSFFKYIEEFSEMVVESASHLRKMTEKDQIESRENSKKSNKKIYELTVEGRNKSKEIIDHIEESFVTPIDREDLHLLSEKLLTVMEIIDDSSDGIILHKIEKYDKYLDAFSDYISEAVEELAKICSNLKNLKKLSKSITEINEINRKSHRIYRESKGYLFSGKLESFEVLRLKNVYEDFSQTVVKVTSVAELAKTISLKHA